MSLRPVTAPPGNPPARIFANVVRSGRMPYSACAPPGETRKPVTTSSKIKHDAVPPGQFAQLGQELRIDRQPARRGRRSVR